MIIPKIHKINAKIPINGLNLAFIMRLAIHVMMATMGITNTRMSESHNNVFSYPESINSDFNGISSKPANRSPTATAAKIRTKKPAAAKKTILIKRINVFTHPDLPDEFTADSEKSTF